MSVSGSVVYCAMHYMSLFFMEMHYSGTALDRTCRLSETGNDKPEKQSSVTDFNAKSDICLWLHITVLKCSSRVITPSIILTVQYIDSGLACTAGTGTYVCCQ